MKLTITAQTENNFLQRKEIQGTVAFEGATPSQAQITEQLVAELKVAPEHLVIKHIYTKYGRHEAELLAYAYFSAEARKHAEPLTAHLKKKAGETQKETKKEEVKA